MVRDRLAAMLVILSTAGALATAGAPAGAQEIAPVAPGATGPSLQTLLELSSTLGEAHAIRTLCNGDGDQTWRVYMQNLMELEAPSGPRKSQLTSAFNRGYRAQSSRRGTCTAEMRQVEAEIAQRGLALSEAAASSYLQ
jgi:uncharacterized protein (TIGR02301 family)